MHELKYLYHRMKDETAEAKDYAMKALSCKKTTKTKAEEYYSIATMKMSVVDSLHKIAVEKVNEIKKANSFIKEENVVTLNTEKKQEFDPMWKVAHDEAVDEYNKVKALLVSYKSA